MSGHIKLDRKILEWEWYKNINVKVLFIHMLLKANWKDGKFQGIDVPRGSFVSSYSKLSDDTGLTIDEVRTAVKNLKKSKTITSKSHSKFTVFTVENWGLYQDYAECSQDSSQAVPKQIPSSSHSVPILFPTIEEVKEVKKGRSKEKNKKETFDYSPLVLEMNYPDAIFRKTTDWLKYKTERKESYTETGLHSLLVQIDKGYKKYGEETIVNLIDECMANSYKGIIWQKLKDEKRTGNKKDDYGNREQKKGGTQYDKYLNGGLQF